MLSELHGISITRYLLLILFLCACNPLKTQRGKIDDYKKVNIISSTGDTIRDNSYEIYISKSDTSRKMLRYYWENGQLQAESYFQNGKKVGKWSTYFDNGALASEGNFVGDEKNGEFRVYHNNGKLSVIEHYTNGIKSNDWHFYDTLGKEIKVEHYKK
ncbi:MAG TPA: hypothetical protein VM802_24465 [Chitinophaga sp.]|uniref:toxin-antitoxin system YwqK family antitoxin n=1 Tax=Chitinophaga sp. TaxID=1869181 RepID=UPI002C70A77B|nr:hypothetical protein [Chitinophaga sp.]HVI48044.1 hypothetical protein [Chitinophaga sp.]